MTAPRGSPWAEEDGQDGQGHPKDASLPHRSLLAPTANGSALLSRDFIHDLASFTASFLTRHAHFAPRREGKLAQFSRQNRRPARVSTMSLASPLHPAAGSGVRGARSLSSISEDNSPPRTPPPPRHGGINSDKEEEEKGRFAKHPLLQQHQEKAASPTTSATPSRYASGGGGGKASPALSQHSVRSHARQQGGEKLKTTASFTTGSVCSHNSDFSGE